MKLFKFLVLVFCVSLFVPGVIAQDVVVPVDHETAELTVLVPDTLFFSEDVDMGSYWEPFTDYFGDGTFALVAGAYPKDEITGMNCKVAFINPDGSIEEYWGFYGDDGEPFTTNFNEARQSGNPPRIACDRRPGGTRYVVGSESTPFLYDEFNSNDRWEGSFAYIDKQIAAVQLFNRNPDGVEPITNVIDPVYGAADIEGVQSDQMRFGGDIRFLSDGNYIVVVEDRNAVAFPGRAAMGTIFDGETGDVIKGPFNAAGDNESHSIWSNMAPFDGGFAVRTEGIMSLYTNDGELQHVVQQADWTTVQDTGRGDGTRIASNITSDFVYITGNDDIGDMKLSRLNAKTGEADKEVTANEIELWDIGTFGRGELAVDELGNICVAYVLTSEPAEDQIVARIFNSDMEPVTPTFFAFQTHEGYQDEIQGFLSKECNVSMTNQRILIAADGVTLDPNTEELTAAEQTFAIVLENPLRDDTAVYGWEIY